MSVERSKKRSEERFPSLLYKRPSKRDSCLYHSQRKHDNQNTIVCFYKLFPIQIGVVLSNVPVGGKWVEFLLINVNTLQSFVCRF